MEKNVVCVLQRGALLFGMRICQLLFMYDVFT
jgi:hypothetical protein